MSSTGLLVVSNIKQIGKSLRAIEKYVNSLYIHLNIPPSLKSKPAPVWSRLISQLYADGSAYVPTNKLDMRILVSPLKQNHSSLKLKPVDMIFADTSEPTELCEKLCVALNIPIKPIYLAHDSDDNDTANHQQSRDEDVRVYNTVVLGGTFDRIHVGHKIFLTQAVLRAAKRLVVGVTTSALTKSKTLPELILPVEERIKHAREFLMEIDCSLHYDIVPIDDPFGPTQHDPDMDMIVVSSETLRGGQKINEVRAAKGLCKLKIFTIDIVESNVNDGIHESKVSSSNTRIDLLGTRLRKVEPSSHLTRLPYIIGLTGGIASGKSKMAERLANFGAYVIDCDKVAHEIYEPGQVCYTKIVKHFGEQILTIDGLNRIDRTKLGPIVFADAQQLEVLNGIVWPELIAEVKRRLEELRKRQDCPKVVVLEAAVLMKAGWETECHEVWSMIVPPEEAVKRVMTRNKLSEEDARKRLASQPSNNEIVAKSHVIFSSQWEHNFTQQQAEKAWNMLTTELATQKLCNL